MGNKIIYKLGERIANLAYDGDAESVGNGYYFRRMCYFLCYCGKRFIANPYDVKMKHVTSCGCKPNRVPKHGHAIKGRVSSEYSIWRTMIQRCHNPNDSSFKRYGALGTKVCKRWRLSFEMFLLDMGNRPSKIHSIDRKRVKGNYTPKNSKWSTKKEQARNRRNSRYVKFKGLKTLLIDLCEKYNINHSVVGHRLKLGWGIEMALTSPIRKKSKINV